MEVITSRQNPLLVKAARLQSSKKYRREQGLLAGDGTKLLEEVLRWTPGDLQAVILREGTPCPPLPDHVRAVQVSPRLMDQISEMEAPEGALFLSRIPKAAQTEIIPGSLVLEGVQDPGNVGTILRTGDALGVPVFLLEGCCDPFSPKTVRASMGAVFRSPPAVLSRETLLSQCREKRVPLLAAALTETAEDIRRFDLKQAAVVIGSEGRGVSETLLGASAGQLKIPMEPRCESLNAAAAAAITLWQMTAL